MREERPAPIKAADEYAAKNRQMFGRYIYLWSAFLAGVCWKQEHPNAERETLFESIP